MNTTKRSFLTSLVSLVLCFTMLLGTTFAWFSDVVTSAGNVIQSGNLDAEMYWSDKFLAADAIGWKQVKENKPIFTYDKWEPGYTEIKYIKVANEGSLNFKWQITIEAEGEVTNLSDVIDVYYVNPVTAKLESLDGLQSEGKLTNVLANKTAESGSLTSGTSTVLAIAFHMDELAGNDYQGKKLCEDGFSVKLVATQATGESDSFDDQYDAGAQWPGTESGYSASTLIDVDDLMLGSLINELTIGSLNGVGATVPADVKIAEGATSLDLTMKMVEADGNLGLGEGDDATSFDVHISGIAADNTKPMIVNLGPVLQPGLDVTELKLYHTENGTPVLMTRVATAADFAIHNQYTYDPTTGNVSIYVATFSVFSAVETSADVWDGKSAATGFASGTGSKDDPYIINTAAQLIYFRNQVDAGVNYAGQFIKLVNNIDLNNKLFNPIGGGWAYNGGKTFNGTFDGGNHTIYNIYVNGWELDATGDKHSSTSMGAGLFSSVHNATIKNLAIVGGEMRVETTSIGIVAGCAQGKCTFDNIVVSDVKLGNYQMRNGGIVGDIYVIADDKVESEYSHTFTNIVVDSSVKLSSMWGDFDTGNGGVIGGKYGSAKVYMENVIVACELDVFSDVTAAYQWYAYRRCGMLVGYTGQNSPKQATNAAADFLTCVNVNVFYGDWVNYTYYQFTNQDSAWQSNYPWVRAQASDYNGPFSNVRYGNPVVGGVAINTIELAETYKTGYAKITFNQLYGGGQGVYGNAEHDGVITNSKDYKTVYVNNDGWTNLKLQYWFANGNDTWTTIVDGIDMSTMLVEENVYKIQLPTTVYAFKIVADGQESKEFILGNLENNTYVDLKTCTHTSTTTFKDNEVASSCTTTGSYDSVTICEDCGEELSRETVTVSANGHTPGAEADCNNAQICTVCTAVITSALGHAEVTDAAVAPTCTTAGKTEGKHCSRCNEVFVAQTTVAALGHITTNFTGNFLYRVGNQNAVELSSLFNVGKHSVSGVSGENVAGSASVTVTGTSLKFNGTGVVKVTLYSNCTCGNCDLVLNLEVVDAVNATSATSATSNNVVLLKNAGFSSLEVSGGYTLYGNGFTLTCSSDSYAKDRTYSFVELKGGTLDNVKIVVPNFSHAIMYDKNKTENGNPSNTDSNGTTRYYNIRSAVKVEGNSKITNSYISGGRAAIYAVSGELTVINSTIYGGAVANIQAEASTRLILEDVTLIQEPIKANVNDTSKTLMGFSVVLMCDTLGVGAPVELKGYLHQYAWAHEGYTQYVPSDGQSAISQVLSQKEYIHKITYEDGQTKDSVNLGFVYMPDLSSTYANNMTDTRSQNEKSKFNYETVSIRAGVAGISVNVAIYTYKNNNGTDEAVKTKPTYTANTQGVVVPNVQYSDVNENRIFTTTYDTIQGLWKSTLKVDVDAGVYTFSFTKLLAQKYGNNLSYTIKTEDGTVVGNNATITLNSAVSNVYILTIIDNQIYDRNGNITGKTVETTYRFELQSTKTSLPAPTWTSTTLNGTPYIVANSKGGDWNCAVPVLDGLKIKYWSKKQNKEIELDLANVVSAAGLSAGLQNGSNNTITITVADEYTLIITTTGFKTNDNGKPVVVNNKLYFTVSSDSNYVSTKTTSRTPNISYVFTDANNSDPITLATSFDVVYATHKGTQYKYSDFCNDKLTTLSSSCVTPDTLVTLADGTQKRIDELTYTDKILAWNFYTGKYEVMPVSLLQAHSTGVQNVLHLYFEDGTELKILGEHGIFDADLNTFIFIDEDDVDNYVGHNFVKQDGDGFTTVKLVGYDVVSEYTTAYTILSFDHYNVIAEGMFTVTPAHVGDNFFNPFDIGEDMKYDEESVKADIEKYGLYTYEDFDHVLTYEQFVALNLGHFKVSVGKGYITYDGLIYLIENFINNEDYNVN